VANSFSENLKKLIPGTTLADLQNNKPEESKKAITRMYKTLCKLAELDLDKEKKRMKCEKQRDDGLIPWYNKWKGKTQNYTKIRLL